MAERIVKDEYDRNMLQRLIRDQKLPFTVTIAKGKRRSVDQNRLQRLWMNEISEQLGDMTPEECRGYCKLTIGVPLLRAGNEAFCEKYDAVVKPLPYESKLTVMMEPLDLPVTRIMTTAQKTQYLEGIYKHFAEKGIVLTIPEDKRFGPAIGVTGDALQKEAETA